MKFFWMVWFAALSVVLMLRTMAHAQPIFTAQSATTQPTNQKINWKQDLNLGHWLLKYDLTTLANHIAAEPPTSDTPAQFLFRLRVYAQAGHFFRIEKAIQAAPSIKLSDESLTCGLFDDLMYFGEFQLVKKLIESDPGSVPVSRIPATEFLDLLRTASSVQETDAWLARMVKLNPGWLIYRLIFLRHHGDVRPFLAQLRAEVEQHPEDGQRACRYVEYWNIAHSEESLDWMTSVCRPALASDCYELAAQMEGRLSFPIIQKYFLELALTRPFTPADEVWIQKWFSAQLPDINWEHLFWAKVNHGLAEIYLKEGQPEKAQPLMEKVARLKPQGIPLGDFAFSAGTVQRISGARVIEQSILENEEAHQQKPEYWISRASYYLGRQELKLFEETIDQAIARFPFRPDFYETQKRIQILEFYFQWLKTAQSKWNIDINPRISRWVQEFETAPIDHTDYAFFLYQQVKPYLKNPDQYWVFPNGRMWKTLATGSSWYGKQDEMWNQIRKAQPDQRKKICSRLERLAKNDPKKQYLLGQAYFQNKLYQQAISLLKPVVHTCKPENPWEVSKLLWDSYLKIADWKSAEFLIYGRSRSDRNPYFSEDCVELVVMAAQHKAFDEALRLWARKEEFDPRSLTELPKLVALGMRKHLIRYYQQKKQADPESAIPDKALIRLQSTLK
ncbi:MAG: hypothetical protein HY774_19385 [Acidobacteria bacterium]|nr:hypothetical protein [Acidobacteriota bacterium]